MGKPSIFVAMPNRGSLRVGHTDNLLRWFLSGKYNITWFPLSGVEPHDRARNTCHREFLNSKCDYIMWLDDDTVPPENIIDDLLYADVDMISAVVQTHKLGESGDPQIVPCSFRKFGKGYKPHFNGSGITKVDATTLAATLIKRSVMENVSKPAFQFLYGDEFGTDGMSEDFYFCERVTESGYSMFCHYDIVCNHFKTWPTKTINRMLIEASNGE